MEKQALIDYLESVNLPENDESDSEPWFEAAGATELGLEAASAAELAEIAKLIAGLPKPAYVPPQVSNQELHASFFAVPRKNDTLVKLANVASLYNNNSFDSPTQTPGLLKAIARERQSVRDLFKTYKSTWKMSEDRDAYVEDIRRADAKNRRGEYIETVHPDLVKAYNNHKAGGSYPAITAAVGGIGQSSKVAPGADAEQPTALPPTEISVKMLEDFISIPSTSSMISEPQDTIPCIKM